MKLIAIFLVVMIPSCAGWDIAPSLEYIGKDGESYKATMKIKVPKNSNK